MIIIIIIKGLNLILHRFYFIKFEETSLILAVCEILIKYKIIHKFESRVFIDWGEITEFLMFFAM